ncbi:MAG: AEC family transporter [Ardenticatenaceae bacterium]|nr:AEC family transporter [Ardenticatenaceae bacterium]
MIVEIASIFLNVITPVFLIAIIGYVAGPRLGLEARTLSRGAYYILIPAFVFNVISTAEINAALAGRMIGFAVVVHLVVTLLAFIVARLLGRPPAMVGAYMVLAVFGNVGNFGLPIILFHLGSEAEFAATFYFLVIVVVAFVISVAAASGQQGGRLRGIIEVFKTPALIAVVPALLVNLFSWPVPLMVERITGLLGAAMVPIMLLTLGVQLSSMKNIVLSVDVWLATAVRLIGGAAVALLLAGVFGLTGLERGAGIFQSAMPPAVLASIIALEYDLLPDFVTTTVLVATVLSTVTLTVLLAVV